MSHASDEALVYLHGFPGGPNEVGLFGHTPDWISRAFIPDRASELPDLDTGAYFDDVANRAFSHARGRSLRLIGFSLGARVALELAVRLGDQVSKIDLISPAGPLDGNNHVDLMAGKMIFTMAAKRPGLFAIQSAAQGWIARHRPSLLYRALFGADGEEAMSIPGFRDRVTSLLHASFLHGGAGYQREILSYVAPWSDLPIRVSAPCTIWQGSLDRWTPTAMAEHLAILLPLGELRPVVGKGHYGTLHHALSNLTI